MARGPTAARVPDRQRRGVDASPVGLGPRCRARAPGAAPPAAPGRAGSRRRARPPADARGAPRPGARARPGRQRIPLLPRLARAQTDGLVLLWRRDVIERLERLAPFASFEVATPLLADGALWWVSYGYVSAAAFPLVRPLAFGGAGAPVRYWRAGLVGAVAA